MAGYQPYGQQYEYAPQPQRPVRALRTAGITYIVARSVLLIGLTLLLLFAASLVPMSQFDGDVGMGMALVVGFFFIWVLYSLAGGVLAIKGYIAGAFMALVDGVLGSLLGLLGLAGGELGGAMCWLVPSIAITITSALALRERYGAQPAMYGAPQYPPQYGAPQGGYANPAVQYGAPQPGYPQPQGYAAPQPAYPQPQPVYQPAPVPGATSAVVPSPKMAALSILALAASVDPDHANDALARARNVAAKLLGPAAQARIQRQLTRPVAVMDVEIDLQQQTAILHQQPNPALNANIVKAAEYVLKGPNGMEPLGEQFLQTLKAQLGV